MPIKCSKQSLVKLLQVQPCSNVIGAVEDNLLEGLEFDSRRVKRGNIFIALQGEKTHGHEFLAQAFANGAALALVESEAIWQASAPEIQPFLLCVKDTYQALIDIATWWREQLTARIIAITGSVGKTTTKEICAALLGPFYKGHAAEKSFNNHVGVPYTICQLDQDDRWGVLEIGMNHPGEIKQLASLAKPHVAVITAVGRAHIEFFQTEEDIAWEKLQIALGLVDPAILILNKDDHLLNKVFNERRALLDHIESIRFFGTNPKADLYLENIVLAGLLGATFTVKWLNQRQEFTTKLLGTSNCLNLTAALLAVVSAFPELSLTQLQEAVSNLTPPDMRLHQLVLPNGCVIIDDSYNANPMSMKAALQFLAELKKMGMKTGAILGEMLELGDFSEESHREIGKLISQLGLDHVIAVGSQAANYIEDSKQMGLSCDSVDNPEEAASLMCSRDLQVILVKASRGAQLERAVNMLKEIKSAKTTSTSVACDS